MDVGDVGAGDEGGRRAVVVMVYPRPVGSPSGTVGEGPVGHVIDVELGGGEVRGAANVAETGWVYLYVLA